MELDVLVVGGGLAGSRAALAIAQKNPQHRIGLMAKTHPIRSHSVAAQGGIAAALQNLDPADNWLAHAYDTIKGSDYLADQDAVELLTRSAPEVIIDLEHLGVLFSRFEDGRIAQRPFGGHTHGRACYAADKTGHAILHELVVNLQRLGVRLFSEWYALELIYEDGEVKGITAFEIESGKIEVFCARSVLLATGGYGRVYRTTSNDFASNGDGLHLATKAGLPLQDMEFVQFHPTGLHPAGVLISEAVRGEGAYLINDLGERFMGHYANSSQRMELSPRDITSRHIEEEILAGRGIGGQNFVYLDVRHLGAEKIRSRIPFAREEGLRFLGIDCIEAPLPVRPTVHYSMGGIPTNTDTQVLDATLNPVPGLFAAGECACVSVHGANRLGANSLLECVVYGRRAGEIIAARLGDRQMPKLNTHTYELRAEQRLQNLLRSQGTRRIADLRQELQETMTQTCGIFRNARSLTQGLNRLQCLHDEYQQNLHLDDRNLTFNMELVQALELRSLLTVAMAIASSALERCESRGAHSRSDFPERDDSQYLRHTLVYVQQNLWRTASRPVNLCLQSLDRDRFSPKERVY
ncbi:MAG: succinate dehydrogenase/fumarate reductase flavoprotein subunit [Oscillatoriales cyanobacterium SM2_2_1]|nr:succinate dehydrogenase/fumarate reductase flavoprotein subunit [Oscillatoriales cyanobacterium SM2_2_1]